MTTVLKLKTNLNCGSCVAAVKPRLDSDTTITSWSVDTSDPNKVLTVEGENLSRTEVKRHVAEAGFKVLGEVSNDVSNEVPKEATEQKSFLQTYKPLLLVVSYLVGVVAVVEFMNGSFNWMRAIEQGAQNILFEVPAIHGPADIVGDLPDLALQGGTLLGSGHRSYVPSILYPCLYGTYAAPRLRSHHSGF